MRFGTISRVVICYTAISNIHGHHSIFGKFCFHPILIQRKCLRKKSKLDGRHRPEAQDDDFESQCPIDPEKSHQNCGQECRACSPSGVYDEICCSKCCTTNFRRIDVYYAWPDIHTWHASCKPSQLQFRKDAVKKRLSYECTHGRRHLQHT